MAPRWVIERLLESVLPFIVMISYRALTFQTLNFQEYCLDVRALSSERPEPSGVMGPVVQNPFGKPQLLTLHWERLNLRFLRRLSHPWDL